MSFVSENDGGEQFNLQLGPSRQAYLVCIEGSLEINGESLHQRDGAEVTGSIDSCTDLSLACGPEGAHFMLLEMAAA